MTPLQIKHLRSNLGDTQARFAVRLNVSLQTVKSWEGGHRNPSGAASRLLEMVRDHGPY